MNILDTVLSKYSRSYEPDLLPNTRTFKISANIDSNHKAILAVLTDKNVVDTSTDALKLLIEAGYKYLLQELPEGMNEDIDNRRDEILEIITDADWVTK